MARAAMGCGEEIVLAPAEQRRDEKPGEVEVVERLDREAGGGEEVLNRQGGREKQAIYAGHRNVFGMETSDDQRGERAPAADENENVLGANGTLLLTPQFEGVVEPVADLLGELAGVATDRVADPPLLARFVRRHGHLLGIGLPQRDGAGTGGVVRSEEQTAELQSLMRISCAVFCLK